MPKTSSGPLREPRWAPHVGLQVTSWLMSLSPLSSGQDTSKRTLYSGASAMPEMDPYITGGYKGVVKATRRPDAPEVGHIAQSGLTHAHGSNSVSRSVRRRVVGSFDTPFLAVH
jgi:hypothetical protein